MTVKGAKTLPWTEDEVRILGQLMADNTRLCDMKKWFPYRTKGSIEQRVRWHRTREIRAAALPKPVIVARIDRDPCPRCGVRADIGCRHTASSALSL